MARGKQLVYRYDGDDKNNEEELDLHDQISVPTKGDVIHRKGRPWKVVHVVTETTLDPKAPLPIVSISLSSDLTLKIFP